MFTIAGVRLWARQLGLSSEISGPAFQMGILSCGQPIRSKGSSRGIALSVIPASR